VIRRLGHNLVARTLRAGLWVGGKTATTLRYGGGAALLAAAAVPSVPLQLAVFGGGGAAFAAGTWLRRKVRRWDGPLREEQGSRRAAASKGKRQPSRQPARRGGRAARSAVLDPGTPVEIRGARPGEVGVWEVVRPEPGVGGRPAYLLAHSESGRPRLVDAARLEVVSPPQPAPASAGRG